MMRSVTSGSRGFTLVEMMVVVGVIIALAGISLPIIGHFNAKSQRDATTNLLRGFAVVIESTQARTVTISVPPARRGALGVSNGNGVMVRRAFDFNGDGLLDGVPGKDPGFDSVDRELADLAEYGGAIAYGGETLESRFVDRTTGGPVDAWGQAVRISFPDEETTLGSASVGLWSIGPDRTPQTADDIRSWELDDAR